MSTSTDDQVQPFRIYDLADATSSTSFARADEATTALTGLQQMLSVLLVEGRARLRQTCRMN